MKVNHARALLDPLESRAGPSLTLWQHAVQPTCLTGREFSGASAWTAQRREEYANDLDADRSLVAVTAKTNRSKSDQDPAEWMPPSADARCTYIADWVSTKLRWQLAADQTERDALARIAEGCGQQQVDYTVAP